MYRRDYSDCDVGAGIIAEANKAIKSAERALARSRALLKIERKRAAILDGIIRQHHMEKIVRMADEFDMWWKWAGGGNESTTPQRLTIYLPLVKDRDLGISTRAEVGRVFGHPESVGWAAEGRELNDGFEATAVCTLTFYHPDWEWEHTVIYLRRPAYLGQTLPSGCTVGMEINTSTSRVVTAACRMNKGDR